MERAAWRQCIVFIPSLSWAASHQGRALPAHLLLFSCRSTKVGMAYHSHSRDGETEALCGNDLSGVTRLVTAEASNSRWLVTSTLCCRSESLWWWNYFSKFLQVWLFEFKGGKKKTRKEEHGSGPCGSSEAAGLGMLVPFCSLSHTLGLLQPDREAQSQACSPTKETIRRNEGRCMGLGSLFSHLVMSSSLWPHGLQHARLPCPSPSGACSNSCPVSRWCHPTISSSLPLLMPSICPSIRVFPNDWLLASGDQSIGALASSFQWICRVDFLENWLVWSCSPKDSQEPSLAIWKHQFFVTQPSLWSNSHICTWLLEKP